MMTNITRKTTRFFLAITVIEVALIAALLAVFAATSHAAVTKNDCQQIAKQTPGIKAVKRAAARGCLRVVAQQELDAQHFRCQHLSGGYVPRNKCTIRLVFGNWGEQAISVSSCESSFRTWATNGQYEGLFQMGSHERATYGDGSDARSQSEAAYRYFAASGYNWSPWQCKP